MLTTGGSTPQLSSAGNPFASGTPQILQPASVALCTAAYPTGGYDCWRRGDRHPFVVHEHLPGLIGLELEIQDYRENSEN
ncbi:MAG TPA: hypothetical protein VNA15_03005 [Candidatus Angelobacter sp.]|nr:hypothetical protein [Candidatus Angelobacter sp.]